MSNKHYQRGVRFERQVKKGLEEAGWIVLRTAGSHGFADLVAVKYDFVHEISIKFIQCKVTKNKQSLTTLLKEFKKAPVRELFTEQVDIQVLLYVKISGNHKPLIYTVGGVCLNVG